LASNARKESSNSGREVRSGGVAGEGSRNRGSRTLLYLEYVRRRAEGRCFYCGGVFVPGHRCHEKNLRVIICAKDERVPAEGEPRYRGKLRRVWRMKK